MYRDAVVQCNTIAASKGWSNPDVLIPIAIDCANSDGSYCSKDVAHSIIFVKRGTIGFVLDPSNIPRIAKRVTDFVREELKHEGITIVDKDVVCPMHSIPDCCGYMSIAHALSIERPQFEYIMTTLNAVRLRPASHA